MSSMQLFTFSLFFLHANGFLLDKSGSTSGQSGISNQYVTSSVFFAESKARHQGDEQLRLYVDQSLSILTSQLEKKFDIVEQKLIKCENQSVHNQSYESLEQQFVDLERKYVDLERKYNQLSVNNDFNLIKNQLVSVQNKTSEISNDVLILKQLGNIKPLQEIQNLQQAVQTVSAQTHVLSVNERARSQDFLALYNMTIDSKRLVSELYANASNQVKDLETNTRKQLLRLEQNLNSTTTGIINQREVKETYDNATMSEIQKQINKNAERVAITAHPSSQGTISNTIIKFDNVKFSVGITNMSAYKTTGKFTCEQEGLYLISASVLSNTNSAHYYVILNGKSVSLTYIGSHSSTYDHTGAVTITQNLHPNDQVWLYADGSWFLFGNLHSQFTIIKIK
ncbi:Hypothetical predicted protein [Mytilus galloprovincialis]|uniref:C1q domain-containing protein n=1 Tax=Mytilus galloprovincialis TaxID=29158 RepID=A0A8B6CW35_MYTGA|nr:Hypothetical predicted protein [Mytilus galloprovincialis]